MSAAHPAQGPLAAEQVVAALTCGLGTLEVVQETGSTNDDVRRLVDTGARLPCVVVAGRQSAGRGRHGRTWDSPAGGLYLSLAFAPAEQTAKDGAWGILPLACAHAVCAALEHACGVKALIKWPNDVVVERDGTCRKLAGILLETHHTPQGTPIIICGIGINVATQPALALAPGALAPLSLEACVAQGQPVSWTLSDVAAAVISSVVEETARVSREALAWLPNRYQRLLVWQGRIVYIKVLSGEVLVEGVCEGLAPTGELVVRDAQGVAHTISAGDVSLRVKEEE